MSNARVPTGTCVLLAAATLIFTLAVAAAPTPAADPKAPNTSCPGGKLDNCYGESQMGEFLQVGRQMVSEYLSHIGVFSRPRLIYIPEWRSVNSACSGLIGLNDSTYAYCPADNTVYIGQRSLWGFYRQYGAAAPIAGIAHEHGHYLQTISGVPDPKTFAETIQHEDQADCVAGDFVEYLRSLGDVEYPQDYRNLGDFLRAIGSREGPGRDHGTPAERVGTFERGFFGGLPACNRFYPNTPLTTHAATASQGRPPRADIAPLLPKKAPALGGGPR
jgi:putative neutral zinc metallopeptidase